MKFLVVAFLVAVAKADVSQIPSGSYLPTGGHIGGGYDSGHIGGGIGGGFHGGIGGGSFHGGIGGGGFHGGIGGGGFHGGIGGGIGGGFGGGFQDQKHVYFYAAPDTEHHSRLRINIAPNSQRNTKIIFVKAPSYGGVVPEVIAPPSLSEDKTLVYVLVKRPEQGGQITIPAGAGIKQTKPEVYFIKYKSQHDAEAQISGSLHGQHVGASVPDVGNESSFVRTLDSGVHHHGGIGGIGGSFGVGGGISHGSGGIGISHGTSGGIGISHGTSGGIGISHGTGSGLVGGGSRYGVPGVSGPY